MTKTLIEKSQNKGGRGPANAARNPVFADAGDNWAGRSVVKAATIDRAMASGAFPAARIYAKVR